MTVLEATVEIVKTAITCTPNHNNYNLISYETPRKELIQGIEEIYKKLEELEKDKKPVSKQY